VTLIAVCDACKLPVQYGCGSLYVLYSDIRAVEQAWNDRGREGTGPLDWESLFSLPRCAHWHVHHDACSPNQGASSYELAIEQVGTWPRLAEWTAHLMAKRWFQHTDWAALLLGCATGVGGRLTQSARAAERAR